MILFRAPLLNLWGSFYFTVLQGHADAAFSLPHPSTIVFSSPGTLSSQLLPVRSVFTPLVSLLWTDHNFPQEMFSRRRSQDGGGIGRVITFSYTNSLKEQQNGEQSLQNNF